MATCKQKNSKEDLKEEEFAEASSFDQGKDFELSEDDSRSGEKVSEDVEESKVNQSEEKADQSQIEEAGTEANIEADGQDFAQGSAPEQQSNEKNVEL